MATILFVSAVGGHGGPVASLLDILPGFEGHRRVAAGAWTDITRNLLVDQVETIESIPRPRGKRAFTAVRVLRSLLRKHRPDVVFANGLTEASITALAMTGLGSLGQRPIWTWIHNYELPTLAGPAAALIRRKDYHWCAVSQLAADLALHNGLADSVSILPNPIAKNVTAAPIAATHERVRVSYLGTDRPYKGFDFLPELIERTRHLPIEWRMHLPVLDKPVWIPMRKLIADPELHINMVGRVSPVSTAYAEADVVVIPSRQESFCRVAAEAMANALPVIATNLSPLQGVVGTDESAGLLAPVGDMATFAQHLERLVAAPALRRTMGEAGVKRAAEYDIDRIRQQWRDNLGL